MEREALKLALEVLEDLPGFRADIDNAITAIKEALAQPEQEPYGYVSDDKNMEFQKNIPEIGRWLKVYTTPPQRTWVGLTNEDWNSTPYDTEFRAGAEWAEAKLKEKNNG